MWMFRTCLPDLENLTFSVHPSTHPGPLSLPVTKSGNWSCTLIAHVLKRTWSLNWITGSAAILKVVLSLKIVTWPPEWHKRVWMYTNFSHNYPPICIPFSKEKHPILLKLGAVCHNLLKIHPIYVIWAPSSLMKTYRSLRQIWGYSIP